MYSFDFIRFINCEMLFHSDASVEDSQYCLLYSHNGTFLLYTVSRMPFSPDGSTGGWPQGGPPGFRDNMSPHAYQSPGFPPPRQPGLQLSPRTPSPYPPPSSSSTNQQPAPAAPSSGGPPQQAALHQQTTPPSHPPPQPTTVTPPSHHQPMPPPPPQGEHSPHPPHHHRASPCMSIYSLPL